MASDLTDFERTLIRCTFDASVSASLDSLLRPSIHTSDHFFTAHIALLLTHCTEAQECSAATSFARTRMSEMRLATAPQQRFIYASIIWVSPSLSPVPPPSLPPAPPPSSPALLEPSMDESELATLSSSPSSA